MRQKFSILDPSKKIQKVRQKFSISLLYSRPVRENSKSASKFFNPRPVKENSKSASKIFNFTTVLVCEVSIQKWFSRIHLKISQAWQFHRSNQYFKIKTWNSLDKFRDIQDMAYASS